MNRNSILIWAMAIGTLSSCMSNEDVYDPEKIAAMKVAKYEAAFVQKYGKVDPKQDWGFGEVAAAMKAVTRGCQTGNGIANYVAREDLPPLIKKDTEADPNGRVVSAFRKNGENIGVNIPVEDLNWTDFFVQHVYAAFKTYTYEDKEHPDNSPQTVIGSEKMDQLGCGEGEKREDMPSFNHGKFDRNRNEKVSYGNDEKDKAPSDFVLMLGTSSRFSYKNSDDSGNLYSNYVVKEIDGAYYIGFDYHNNDKNRYLEPDGNYDDWIIKVTPAKFKNARRIMAEDLVVDSKSDFDFNDVVFDAAIVGGEAVITLQAVGGVLPLHIGSEDSEHEVHKLFGVEQNVFVNTRNKGEKAPVMFRLSGCNSLDDIAIVVDGQAIGKQLGTEAPAKLCCPTKYSWAPETTSIDTYFPNFADAVSDAKEVWYEDGSLDDLGWQVANN